MPPQISGPISDSTKDKSAAAPDQPTHSGTESEWIAAMAMLKFSGSMKMGGQEVAMINGKILRQGDTISVVFHEKEFKFILMNISPNGVEYKRELKQ
jgi:hypothetical protein